MAISMEWMRNLRIRQLRMLLRLCELGSISQVAEEFSVTQPAVSKWLKEFEQTVGVELFVRHARGLQALPIALEIARQAKDILSRLDRVQNSINQIKHVAHRQIAVGISPIMAYTLLPQAITAFHKQFPKTFIQLHENTLDRLLSQLYEGEIDVIICRAEKNATFNNLCSYPLRDISLALAVDAAHPLAHQEVVSWEQVLNYPWITPPAESPIRQQMKIVFNQLGIGEPSVLIESSFVALTAKLLKGTTLVAPIASDLLGPLGLSHRLHVPDLNSGLNASLTVLWRPNESNAEIVHPFIRCLKSFY